MSWVYVPASGESNSASIELEALELSATLKKTLGVWLSLLVESGMVYSVTPLSGQSLKPSTESRGVELWIASLRASRVSQSPPRASGSARRMNGGFGPKSSESFARYDPESSCWRTSQGSLFEGLDKLLGGWPRSGITVNGTAYRLPLSVPRMSEIECGLLLPTPNAGEASRMYVMTLSSARRRVLHQGSWIATAIVLKNLKKGWANPRFSEAMMGFPIGWTDLEPLEMP